METQEGPTRAIGRRQHQWLLSHWSLRGLRAWHEHIEFAYGTWEIQLRRFIDEQTKLQG